jgi:hypothetical protein
MENWTALKKRPSIKLFSIIWDILKSKAVLKRNENLDIVTPNFISLYLYFDTHWKWINLCYAIQINNVSLWTENVLSLKDLYQGKHLLHNLFAECKQRVWVRYSVIMLCDQESRIYTYIMLPKCKERNLMTFSNSIE